MKLVNGKRSQLLEYLMIIAGTGLMALAINSVFDASGMVTGGFSGIAIIIKAGSQGIIDGGIPLWVTNMGLNIPLFLIGWKINGFSFVKKALIGEIALSTWLAIEPVWNLAGNDLLLAAAPSEFSAFELELNALVRRHFPHWGARDLLGDK